MLEFVRTKLARDMYNPVPYTGISLGMRSANERRRYSITTSLTGWAHT